LILPGRDVILGTYVLSAARLSRKRMAGGFFLFGGRAPAAQTPHKISLAGIRLQIAPAGHVGGATGATILRVAGLSLAELFRDKM
jgi:hypothetical protein